MKIENILLEIARTSILNELLTLLKLIKKA